MIKLELTKEELQMIQTALVFTSCTEACYQGKQQEEISLARLSQTLHQLTDVGPEKNIYIHNTGEFENTEVFHLLEKFTKTKEVER